MKYILRENSIHGEFLVDHEFFNFVNRSNHLRLYLSFCLLRAVSYVCPSLLRTLVAYSARDILRSGVRYHDTERQTYFSSI